MPLTTKVTPFEKTVKILVDSRLSPEARSKRIASFARQEIAEGDAINRRALGTVPPKTVTVDGREGAPLESVNPDRGIIIAEWQLVGDVLQFIHATLRARSPIISGEYLRGHTLYADGTETDAVNPPLTREYIFLNPLPYTRKIEIGKTKAGRDFVIQVENRIYERTADDAKKRFGNVANVRFGYQSLANVGATPIGKWAGSASAQRLFKKHKRRTGSTEWLTRVPAITVTLK